MVVWSLTSQYQNRCLFLVRLFARAVGNNFGGIQREDQAAYGAVNMRLLILVGDTRTEDNGLSY